MQQKDKPKETQSAAPSQYAESRRENMYNSKPAANKTGNAYSN